MAKCRQAVPHLARLEPGNRFFVPFNRQRRTAADKNLHRCDGLLRDNVYKIKQDSRGFLWFCTVEGVSRFDGYAFTNFITDDGLPDRHANDFLETKSGEIYDGASIKLSMDIRRELYLVFKEAVSNAARHSDCKNIEVNFQLERGAIFLQIADHGKGFDVSEKADGNGLENMRSRAAKNGGEFKIESQTKQGTIVKIRFPQN